MLDTSKIYESNNYGPFKIVSYSGYDSVEVMFIDTGYRTTTEAGNVRRGNVKDYLAPSVFGVGFIGDGIHKTKINGKQTKAYKTWSSMFVRCYCPKLHAKYPTYKECSVGKEWLNFQAFAEWFYNNYTDGLHLDKDIIKKGNKIYCPEFCKFVTHTENVIEAHAKNYEFISPDGIVTKIYNLADFCRNNKLNTSHMSNVNRGKRKHHKGWTK